MKWISYIEAVSDQSLDTEKPDKKGWDNLSGYMYQTAQRKKTLD